MGPRGRWGGILRVRSEVAPHPRFAMGIPAIEESERETHCFGHVVGELMDTNRVHLPAVIFTLCVVPVFIVSDRARRADNKVGGAVRYSRRRISIYPEYFFTLIKDARQDGNNTMRHFCRYLIS